MFTYIRYNDIYIISWSGLPLYFGTWQSFRLSVVCICSTISCYWPRQVHVQGSGGLRMFYWFACLPSDNKTRWKSFALLILCLFILDLFILPVYTVIHARTHTHTHTHIHTHKHIHTHTHTHTYTHRGGRIYALLCLGIYSATTKRCV